MKPVEIIETLIEIARAAYDVHHDANGNVADPGFTGVPTADLHKLDGALAKLLTLPTDNELVPLTGPARAEAALKRCLPELTTENRDARRFKQMAFIGLDMSGDNGTKMVDLCAELLPEGSRVIDDIRRVLDVALERGLIVVPTE